MSNYIAHWKEEPPFDWCKYRKSHPRENTCSHWAEDITDTEEFIKNNINIDDIFDLMSHDELYSKS